MGCTGATCHVDAKVKEQQRVENEQERPAVPAITAREPFTCSRPILQLISSYDDRCLVGVSLHLHMSM